MTPNPSAQTQEGQGKPCPQDIIVSLPLVITTETTIADYIQRWTTSNRHIPFHARLNAAITAMKASSYE